MQTKRSMLEELYDLTCERMQKRAEGAYMTYLLDKGEDKICGKVGEEVFEVVLAVKNHKPDALVGELADLFFHLTVLMAQQGVSYEQLYAELEKRRNS